MVPHCHPERSRGTTTIVPPLSSRAKSRDSDNSAPAVIPSEVEGQQQCRPRCHPERSRGTAIMVPHCHPERSRGTATIVPPLSSRAKSRDNDNSAPAVIPSEVEGQRQ